MSMEARVNSSNNITSISLQKQTRDDAFLNQTRRCRSPIYYSVDSD